MSGSACAQMSDTDRSRMKPPVLTLTYAAAPVAAADEASVDTYFAVAYVNSKSVRDEFWGAWQICMGLFVVLAGLVAGLRWYKWRVRAPAAGLAHEPWLVTITWQLAHWLAGRSRLAPKMQTAAQACRHVKVSNPAACPCVA